MVTKRELGTTYLVAVGVTLLAVLLGGVLVPLGWHGVSYVATSPLAAVSEAITAIGLVVVGGILTTSDFDGERVWRIATWFSAGLGLPTTVVVLIAVFQHDALGGLDWRSVAILVILSGGLVGFLTGTLTELRDEHQRVRALNQRNTVFLRLFRHDIRNSANIVRGHADPATADERSARVVHDQIDRIVRLSDAARQLDHLDDHDSRTPVDLARVVEDRAAALRDEHPNATIETTLPTDAHVLADDLLPTVVENLLQNSVEHSSTGSHSQARENSVEHGSPCSPSQTQEDSVEQGSPAQAPDAAGASGGGQTATDGGSRPHVRVRVDGDDETVTLTVTDDGPGFSDEQLAVHTDGRETPLEHGNGIGLWLVRWIVAAYDGGLELANRAEGGARVRVDLPAVDPETKPRRTNGWEGHLG